MQEIFKFDVIKNFGETMKNLEAKCQGLSIISVGKSGHQQCTPTNTNKRNIALFNLPLVSKRWYYSSIHQNPCKR